MYLVEAVDEVDDGGLACPCASYEGDLLSGIGVDIDVEEYLLLGGVAEIDVLEVDVTLSFFYHPFTIIHFGFGIAEGEDALGSYGGVEHTVDLLTDLCDGTGEVLVELEESHYRSEGDGRIEKLKN